MSQGKYLSLEETLQDSKLLKRFIEEHPEKADRERFELLLDAMCKAIKKPSEDDPS